MKQILIPIFGALISSGCVLVPSPPQESTLIVTGQVLDGVTHSPVPDATVVLKIPEDDERMTLTTNETGAFTGQTVAESNEMLFLPFLPSDAESGRTIEGEVRAAGYEPYTFKKSLTVESDKMASASLILPAVELRRARRATR